MKKNTILISALFFTATLAYAQQGRVGINTSTPAATLDVTASPSISTRIDGFIAPRLKGSELKAKDGLYTTAQDGTIVYVTEAVSGVTDKTTNVTSIGYYYFDKTQGTNGRWMKIANPTTTTYQEPWVVQGGTTPATTNSQAISQNASVAIGKSTAYNSTNQTMLDVAGAVRGGTGQSGIVGSNSAAFGNGTIASGTESFASGLNTTSSGSQSFAVGNANTASGNGSFAGGYYVTSGATASGQSAFAFGANGTAATANYSLAIGNNAKANGVSSFAFGNGATASNTGSLAFGNGNTVSADYGVTIGLNNKASGTYAVALGQGTTASGLGSFSGGYFNSGTSLGSTASGLASFAFGSNGTNATGDFSLAFGNNSNSVGANSFALGQAATASFNHSVAIGLGTNAPVRSGVSLGRFNRYTTANYTSGTNSNNNYGDPIFQLGQGSDNGTRANIITGYYGMNTNGSFENGWVVIGANPSTVESVRLGTSERLTVYGNIVASGQYYASTSTVGTSYPDYVFQRYYNGSSDLNNSYKFTNLYDTEKYIIKNNHLPGVTAFADLKTATDGSKLYSVSELSLQSLEKIEELYLHTIDQQKQIDELKDLVKTQQEQINQLLKK